MGTRQMERRKRWEETEEIIKRTRAKNLRKGNTGITWEMGWEERKEMGGNLV
jgi:hypothetical protein